MRRIICTLAVAAALLITPAGFAQQRLYASHKTRSSGGATASPAFSPGGSTYNTAQSVTISDSTTGAVIYYTTDGTTPTTSSTQYSGPISVTKSATLKAMAVDAGMSKSAVATANYVISAPTTPVTTNSPSYGIGFTSSGLALNGGAAISGNRLRLTDGGAGEARTAFFTTPVNVQSFTNSFTFQLTNASADGFTFTIQGDGATAVGRGGGGLGYAGLVSSAAVKFDLYSNAGEGSDSTGLFTNGTYPTVPSSDMSSSGLDLHSGDVMNVQMTYDGTTLTWTITDATAGTQYQTSAVVNIPSLVGSNTAYVGFTGGTGGLTATQDILTWTFVPGAALTNSVVPATSPTQPAPVSLPQITTSGVPSGAVNVSYSATLAATSGVPPYSWSVSGGQLAPGLTLQGGTGKITGMPTQAGTFSFSTQVTDSSNQTASANFSANIAPAASPVISGVSPSSGPTVGGTTVTISGSNFQAGASVTFGGTAASSVTVSSSSQILAVAPGHLAGSVGVIVQENGQSSSSVSYTYNAIAPTVSGISPNNGPTAGGTSVTISGTNFLSGATVLFGSAQASNVTVLSATQIQAVTPANAAGLTTVAVENPGNLSANLASGFTYNGSQSGPPTISSVSPTSGTPGTQVTITGTNFNSADVVSFGSINATPTTFVSATQLLASVPSVSAGSYNVTVTDPDPASVTLTNGFSVTSAAPAQSLLSGCTYVGSGGCSLPGGWNLVTQQDFECSGSHAVPANPGCGVLPAADSTSINATPNGFETAQNHTPGGSYGFGGLYSGDSTDVNWLYNLNGGNIGNIHSVYISFWDYVDPNAKFANSDYLIANLNEPGNMGCSIGFDAEWYGASNVLSSTSTWMLASGTGDPGSINCQGSLFVDSNGNAVGAYPFQMNPGVWTQYEILVTPSTTYSSPAPYNPPETDCTKLSQSTAGCGNGTIELWVNGQKSIYITNSNTNGTDNFNDPLVWVGGFITSFGADGATRCSNFNNNSGTCAGAPTPFHRYFDDIIVLKQ